MENFTTETIELAEALINIETANYHTWAEWCKERKTKWKLSDEVIAERSEDKLAWYLWKRTPDQARVFLKVLPTDMSEKTYRVLIESQPWVCI